MMIQGVGPAIAWMSWRRNRSWIYAGAAYFVAAAAACQLMPQEASYHVVSMFLCMPFAMVVIWLLGEFTFGKEFDLTSCESGFPVRMYTLPASTAQLVAWPMLLGALCMAVSWIFFSGLLLRPRGVELPWFWPPVFAAILLGWIQVLSWIAFPHAWLRVAVALTWLSCYVAGTIAAVEFDVPEAAVVAGLIAQAPLIYLIALRGVAVARCGNGPQPWKLPALLQAFSGRPTRFKSPQQAQLWFEWGVNGRSLPVMSFFLTLGFVVAAWATSLGSGASSLRFVAALPWLPVLYCTTAALSMARFRRKQEIEPMPFFMATRPIATGQFVVAKLRAAAKSVIVCYVIIWSGIALCCFTTDAGQMLEQTWRAVLIEHSTLEAMALGASAVITLPVLAWLMIANNLWFGLTGCKWVGLAYSCAIGVLLTVSVIVGTRLYVTPELHPQLHQWAPWVLGTMAALKLSVAAAVCFGVARWGLLRKRVVAGGAAAWIAFVLIHAGIVIWYAGGTTQVWQLVPSAFILLTPALGLALSPLALDWNRHGN